MNRFLPSVLALSCGAAIPAVADTPMVDPAHVLSSVSVYLGEDGIAHRATLVLNLEEGGADLYLATKEWDGFSHIAHAPAFVWTGAMAGTEPFLEVQGSHLIVTSMNESIGRNRWQQHLTVDLVEGVPTVTRFVYESWDTLDLDNEAITCDVDLVTGEGTVTRDGEVEASFVTLLNAQPVDAWDMNLWPFECFEDGT